MIINRLVMIEEGYPARDAKCMKTHQLLEEQ